MFQAFFGDGVRARDEASAEKRQIDYSNMELEQGDKEVGSKTTSKDAFTAGFEYTHTGTSDFAQLRNHGMSEYQQSSKHTSGNPVFATPPDIDQPSNLSDILTPRNETRGSQKSLAEMILMLRGPTLLGTRDPQERGSVSKSFPKRVEKTQATLTTHSGTALEFSSSPSVLSEVSDLVQQSDLESSISPLTLSQQEDSVASPDAEKRLHMDLNSTFAVVANLEDMASTTSLEHIETPPGAVTVFERGSVTSQYMTSSPDSMSCSGLEQDITSDTGWRRPNPDIEAESPWTLFRSSDGFDPKVQFHSSERGLGPVAKAPTKRICELVAESQSCNDDFKFHSLPLAGPRNTKRNFREYSAGVKDIDTQRLLTNLDGGENCTVKRHRFSIV